MHRIGFPIRKTQSLQIGLTPLMRGGIILDTIESFDYNLDLTIRDLVTLIAILET